MGLPDFTTQESLFSTAGFSAGLLPLTDCYRRFSLHVYPRLAAARARLAQCYCPDHGRGAVEPVLRLGVSVLPHLDGMPDRWAVDVLLYVILPIRASGGWRGGRRVPRRVRPPLGRSVDSAGAARGPVFGSCRPRWPIPLTCA
jgi:hypothetical protein